MAVDVALIQYFAYLVIEGGTKYNLTKAVTAITLEEQEGQLAEEATLTVAADSEVQGEDVKSIMKLNRVIRISADWGEGKKKIFEGILWEWEYQHAQQKTLSIVAYDPMIRLQQGKDHKYFSAGMDTKALISAICGDFGVSVSYKWKNSMKHEKKVFRSNTVIDMVMELLEEVRKQKGGKYVTLYRDGKLEINNYGTNKEVYKFGPKVTLSTKDKLTMDKLVTRVKVLGKADDKGRSSVDAVVNGNLDFGILQEIVTRDSDKDLGKAKAEANTIIKERGKPEESIIVTAPDLPFLRKGDAVNMAAGNLSGKMYVLGVSHNAATRQMSMTLTRDV